LTTVAQTFISLVVPVFNEASNLRRFHETATLVLRGLPDCDWEFVFVDDGSRDESFAVLEELRARDKRVTAVRFARNFGSHIAIAAGMEYCHGDCAAIMAADLQDPPELLPEFLSRWRDGAEIVWGARTGRDDGWLRGSLMRLFYAAVRRFAIPGYPKGGTGSFCLVSRKVIDAFEGLIGRIPVVETVYSASKKLIGVLQQKPDGAARVVLIEFPHAGMKAIGLVMRLFTDAVTGEELAAVFVPTTPNPTSGYLEIVPLSALVPTTMTMDQAMTMIVSGGAVAPENFSIAPGPRPSHQGDLNGRANRDFTNWHPQDAVVPHRLAAAGWGKFRFKGTEAAFGRNL
jgi:hypothetical protein